MDKGYRKKYFLLLFKPILNYIQMKRMAKIQFFFRETNRPTSQTYELIEFIKLFEGEAFTEPDHTHSHPMDDSCQSV